MILFSSACRLATLLVKVAETLSLRRLWSSYWNVLFFYWLEGLAASMRWLVQPTYFSLGVGSKSAWAVRADMFLAREFCCVKWNGGDLYAVSPTSCSLLKGIRLPSNVFKIFSYDTNRLSPWTGCVIEFSLDSSESEDSGTLLFIPCGI